MKHPTTAELSAAIERDPIRAVRLAVATVIAAGNVANPNQACLTLEEMADQSLNLADKLIARTIAATAS